MAVGLTRGPNVRDRHVGESAGIQPYKLSCNYASVTAFLAAKSLYGENATTAEEGDQFYCTASDCWLIYDSTSSLWRRLKAYADDNFFRWVPRNQPVANGPAGAAVSGTAQALNAWSVGHGLVFQAAPFGTQTILAPILDTTTGYLDLGSQDQTATDGVQISPSFSGTSAKYSFTTGTSNAFYTRATFKVATVANCGPLHVGFKIQAAPAALSTSRPNYTEMAGLGIILNSNAIKITTQKASGGLVVTDTTQTATDATAITFTVLCSSAGVWTYQVNGSAPTATAALTATASSIVCPFIQFAQGTAQTACLLQLWECGYQIGVE